MYGYFQHFETWNNYDTFEFSYLQAKLAFERLKIEHVYHPFIAGANASKIMEQTGARINIPPPSAQKDEITIAGEKDGVATAKETIMAIYEEKKRKTTTVSIEVKKSQHKYVIGPRGGTLQEILALTGKEILEQSSGTFHCLVNNFNGNGLVKGCEQKILGF